LGLGFTPQKRRAKKAIVVVEAGRWIRRSWEFKKDGGDGEKVTVAVAAAIDRLTATAER
jgi:hypothetical protein